MTPPELVLFDIGNVLIRWQPEAYYDGIVPLSTRRDMFANVDLHAMNDRIDKGGNFRTVVYDCAKQHPQYSDLIRRWHDNWLDLAQPAITASAHLNEALRNQGIKTGILSNIGAATFALAQNRYPFLKSFDQIFLSGPMGTIKPEPLIYEMVEEKTGLSGQQLLFTDDRIDNINAAVSRGWQTHLFTDAKGWAADLVARGLLTESTLTKEIHFPSP